MTASARLQGGALAEAGQGVAAAQLLRLPRSHRLQAVAGDDVGDAVEQLGQVAAEVGVPGVAVDQVGPGHAGGHEQVDRHGAQGGALRAAAGQRVPRAVGRRHQVAPGRGARRSSGPRRRPAGPARGPGTRRARPPRRRPRAGTPWSAGRPGPRPAGPAPQVRWTCSPLPTTTTPWAETVKRAVVGLRVDAERGAGVDLHVLVDDGVADDRALARSPPRASPPSSRPGRWARRGRPGESTDRRTRPPETMAPAQTMRVEGPARRRWGPPARTWPAAGSGPACGWATACCRG